MMSTHHILAALISTSLCGLLFTQSFANANPGIPTHKLGSGLNPPPPKPPVANVPLGQSSLAQCAPGFTKTSEQKNQKTGVINKFVCTTPIIKCPKNPNHNQSVAEGKVDTNAAQNPEQGALTLSYSCTYSTPEQ